MQCTVRKRHSIISYVAFQKPDKNTQQYYPAVFLYLSNFIYASKKVNNATWTIKIILDSTCKKF